MILRVPEDMGLEEAVKCVSPDGIIAIRPGKYILRDILHITRPVTIKGAGVERTVIISTAGDCVIRFECDGEFELGNITIRRYQNMGDILQILSGSARINSSEFVGTGGFYDKEGERKRGGIFFGGSSRGTVYNCILRRNVGGLIAGGSSVVDLLKNVSGGNTYAGIVYYEGSSGMANRNFCLKNGFAGIYVLDAAAPRIVRNNCSNNDITPWGCGIAYTNEAGGTAEENSCSENSSGGIYVAANAAPRLFLNLCERNKAYGIMYYDKASGIAERNVCAGSFYGIGVSGKANPHLLHNVCEHNEFGIEYTDMEAAGTAKENITEDNPLGAVCGNSGAPGGIAEENICWNNKRGAIDLDASAHPVLKDNDITQIRYFK